MLDKMGYNTYYQVLNAKDYGIPQNRERVFTISIRKDIDKGYLFPQKENLKLKLKDILEKNVNEKYYLSDKMIKYISATGTSNFKNPDSKINLDVARPLTTDQNKRAGTTNYISDELPNNYDLGIIVKNQGKEIVRETDIATTLMARDWKGFGNQQMTGVLNTRIRRLTPKECWRLMGFDDIDFDKAKLVNSDTQLYKQAGNSIVVNVLEKILNNLLK